MEADPGVNKQFRSQRDLSLLAFKREKLAGRQTEAYSRCFNLISLMCFKTGLSCLVESRGSGGGQLLPLSYPNLPLFFRALGHNSVNHRWS
jgi:hypothetical protein